MLVSSSILFLKVKTSVIGLNVTSPVTTDAWIQPSKVLIGLTQKYSFPLSGHQWYWSSFVTVQIWTFLWTFKLGLVLITVEGPEICFFMLCVYSLVASISLSQLSSLTENVVWLFRWLEAATTFSTSRSFPSKVVAAEVNRSFCSKPEVRPKSSRQPTAKRCSTNPVRFASLGVELNYQY